MTESHKKGGALDSLMLLVGLGMITAAALLGGAVALTWQPRHTDSLIATSAAICGGGFVMFALVIGLVVGISFFKRLNDQRDAMPPMNYPPVTEIGWQESQPPTLANPDKTGTWAGGGPQTYDLWQDESETPPDRQWAEVNV